ncbi:uncharacterized protein STEHIDRAFT_158926 [Stereum hirsutum FP-91666 SS1]|uniref:uncharacterized protein n=1 Tax=Stereum hirsutum (strain FP-91666) TaxID=721885 RepID=UPI0004449FDF|nr:uncharacterized protein STEHIDRAFT_158926 [Stereum hirsutum FP-91666 SS1]EIM84236.1 hypothetical protein STEHIDRAFT_158926 [Stereum hirsutum FP-91666 SS1]
MGLGKLLDTTAAFKQAGSELLGSSGNASSSSTASLSDHDPRPHININTNTNAEQRPLLDGRGRSYGGTQGGDEGAGGRRLVSSRSPEAYRRRNGSGSLPKVDEDEDGDGEDGGLVDVDNEEFLEERGLYVGSYKMLLWQYTLVPICSLGLLVLLSFLPRLIYHTPLPHTSSLPSSLPFPLPELLLSSALWSLSHILSTPLYTLLSYLLSPTLLGPHPSRTTFSPRILFSFLTHPSTLTILNTSLLVLLRTSLRLAPLAILGLRHQMDHVLPTPLDPVFWRVWMGAIGWSVVEVGVGVWQGWEWVGAYRDVLVKREDVPVVVERLKREEGIVGPAGENGNGNGEGMSGSYVETDLVGERQGTGRRPKLGTMSRRVSEAEIELEVEKDLDELAALKTREELEELYGYPVIRTPVFILILLRLASIFLSLGFTLLLSSTYLSSPISLSSRTLSTLSTPSTSSDPPPPHLPHPSAHPYPTNSTFTLIFFSVFTMHLCLALLHTHLVLPSVGVHVVAYVGLIVGLGAVFGGLGMWGGLV